MAKHPRFKLPPVATFIGIIVLGTIILVDQLNIVSNFPDHPKQITLDRSVPLYRTGDATKVMMRLKKGDVVSFLAVHEGTGNTPAGLMVQTRSGLRGLISAVDLGYPQFYKAKADSIVPCTVKGVIREPSKYKNHPDNLSYSIVTQNGKKETVGFKKVRPVIPDSLRDYQFNDKGQYFMTREKFERLYMGKKLRETDRLYHPARMIDRTSTGFIADFYNLQIVDMKTGYVHGVEIKYNKDSVAVSYDLSSFYNMNNRTAIKYMPLLAKIVDIDILARFIEGSISGNYANFAYENYTEEPYSIVNTQTKAYIAMGVIGILVCLWAFFMCTLPLLLLNASLYCRYIWYFLPDRALKILFNLVGFAWTYTWVALGIAWGCISWFAPLIFIIGFFGWMYAVGHLDVLPHDRCENCRAMDVNIFKDREFIREYDQWRSESEKTGSHTDRWQTWTQVTESWGNGTTNTYRKDVRDHSRTESYYKDYEVLYHVKEYVNHYECQRCHAIESLYDEELHELKRRKVGERTEVSYSDF